ncbi:uncharacterized protein involved in exopolysaccharide biosynthesis [Bradyrhizobium diazoefficiens]
MLQINTDNRINRDYGPPPEFRPGPVVPLAEVLAVLRFIRRHVPIISLTCCAALCISILYLIIAVPTFTAKAQLLVNSKLAMVDASAVSTVVESQIAIIKSESIATAVIEKLDLAQDPEFAAGQVSGTISRLLGWSKPKSEASAARYALEPFERKLSAKRVGPTFLIEITFDSRDPDRAAEILNALVERYITHQMDNAGLQDTKWVKDRLNELSVQALAAQKALENYRKDGNELADSAATIEKLAAAAESTKNTYDSFRHVVRKAEVTQQQTSPVFEASLVAGAFPPLKASWPKARIVLGISALGGLLLGVAIGVLRDLWDRGTYASGQEPRLSAQDGGIIERAVSDAVRPDLQSDASAKARAMRFTGSG